MPQRVFCNVCNATLYDGLELEAPAEIIQRYRGECPKCQKPLKFEPEKVKISPFEEDILDYLKNQTTVRIVLKSDTQHVTSTSDPVTSTNNDIQKNWHYKEDDKK